MLRSICVGVCASLLCPTLLASTVFRCEDSSGHITYTLQGCPTEARQDLQNADNPTPGQGKAVPLAKTNKRDGKRSKKTDELVVVGEKQDGCGNRITGSTRRTAMIRQQVRSGMTQADVQSSLGAPDKITSQDGQTRYHYEDKKGNRRQVTFDEAGCVKAKH
ncbi:MAG TPA: DUF4124 domain-containing protein [Pseudomonas sp.]|nr:DUF4124 domain-containing protein [Pseudomonas sp.]